MRDNIAYATSIVVIVISVLLIALLPVSDAVKSLFSLPGVIGLFMLLIQGWRDQVAHERAKELLQKQHEFDLAIASHMADVVFDKQVSFCEAYSQKLYAILLDMFQKGPDPQAMQDSNALKKIRQEFSPWISKQLTEKLTPYESALRTIASLKTLADMDPNDPNRQTTIEMMYETWARFLGISITGIPHEPQGAADVVLEHLRGVLNVPDLENLRHRAIEMASSRIGNQ